MAVKVKHHGSCLWAIKLLFQPQISAGKSQRSPNSCIFFQRCCILTLYFLQPRLPWSVTIFPLAHLWVSSHEFTIDRFQALSVLPQIKMVISRSGSRRQELGVVLPLCQNRSTHAGKCPGPGAAECAHTQIEGGNPGLYLGQFLKQKGSAQNTRK